MHNLTNKKYCVFLSIGGIAYLTGGLVIYNFIQPGEPWWARFLLILPGYVFTGIFVINRFTQFQKNLNTAQIEIENMHSLNRQAAHGLTPPAATINVVADKIKYDHPKLYRLLKSSIDHIDEISSDLLSPHRTNKDMNEPNFFDLENNISQLVNDKRKEHQDIKNLFIFYRIKAPLLQEVNIPKSEFHRVLSNIINNSVDAMSERSEKRIKIEINPLDSFIEVIIFDNGCGIKESNLDQIFIENVSFKTRGTGNGLSYVKKTVEKWGGRIQLLETNSSGTSFRLLLPSAP